MNALTVIMLGLIVLALNVALIALAVQLGTRSIRTVLEHQSKVQVEQLQTIASLQQTQLQQREELLRTYRN